jgi:hypothetical protein
MQAHDQLDYSGGLFEVEVIRDGKHGPRVIERRVSHNLVTTVGKRRTWRMAAGLVATNWDQMRVGTSGAAPCSVNANLLSKVAGTLSTCDSKTMDGRTFQLVISYPSGSGKISATGIKEVCVLDQNTSPGGSALARATFTAVNKTTSDKLKITYSVRIT